MLAVLLSLVGRLAASRQYACRDSGERSRADRNLAFGPSPPTKPSPASNWPFTARSRRSPNWPRCLSDEQLASWARIALEAIPDPSADEALRTATKTLERRTPCRHDQFDRRSPRCERRRCAGRAFERSGCRSRRGRRRGAGAHRHGCRRRNCFVDRSAETTGKLQSAVAEGCILCAERLMADGRKRTKRAAIYEQVRKASLPKQRILEATRGESCARRRRESLC